MNHEDSAQKVHKKCTKKYTKKFSIAQIFISVITLIFCFISLVFDYHWNSRISSSLKPFFKFFMSLFYFIKTNQNCNTKVQHVCCVLTCCTFSRKVLVSIFNLGYTWYLVKDFFCNQSTISDWSEDVKQNKTMKLSVLKGAKCEICVQGWMLRCTVLFVVLFTYKQTNSYLTVSRACKSFFSIYYDK